MEIPKPTEADKERFRAIAPADPQVEVKPMFGNLGAFVNGNMFMGLFGADIGLKLAPADGAELGRTRWRRTIRAGGAADGRLRLDASIDDRHPRWRSLGSPRA